MNNMMHFDAKNINNNNKEQILYLINQNIQMENQIIINNNMIKNLIENSNHSSENMNTNNNLYDDLFDVDFFPGKIGARINVIFESGTTKINVVAPLDTPMKELLQIFYVKLQIYGKYFKKKIHKLNDYYFLYRALKISLDEKRTLFEYGLNNMTEHIIFDLSNILIGG